MWKGKMTKELHDLVVEYAKENDGAEPDFYDEICYNDMPYDEYVGYIKEALRRHCCIVDVID